MSEDDDIFDWYEARTRSRLTDPDTSHAAYAKIAYKMNECRREVLHYFVHRVHMTDLDLQEHFDNHLATYRTRRSELTEMGYIADSGARILQNDSNRIIWVITPLGREAAKLFPVGEE